MTTTILAAACFDDPKGISSRPHGRPDQTPAIDPIPSQGKGQRARAVGGTAYRAIYEAVMGSSPLELRRRYRLEPNADILPHLDSESRRWIVAARRQTRSLIGNGTLGQAEAARVAVWQTRETPPGHISMSLESFLGALKYRRSR